MSARAELVAEQLSCVRTADLSCADPRRCWELGHCAYSRDSSKRLVTNKPEPKRVARIKDAGAIRRKMRGETVCRCGCGQIATDGHHILPRSLGGDDVPDNIVGLNHWCHMGFEFGTDDRVEVGERVGSRLRDREIEYVLGKLRPRAFGGGQVDPDAPGWDFLKRYYGVERREIERREG